MTTPNFIAGSKVYNASDISYYKHVTFTYPEDSMEYVMGRLGLYHIGSGYTTIHTPSILVNAFIDDNGLEYFIKDGDEREAVQAYVDNVKTFNSYVADIEEYY